ncbi:alanine racemase [Streptomyces sp. TLI_053]|uniref:alanine racemase n=1 Tax=Streptomyces sp. TLI_053 TaxID=1855352 RepID=UPI001E43F1CD|nr:alanine racemase [Streptomyces sp. TLI_053]
MVDLAALDGNIARMQAAARTGGFALRPHAKAHKCPQVARRQLAAGAEGLTVATLAEAEVFVAAGCEDLFVATPMWIDEAKGRRLGQALGGAAGSVEVLVEVDCGIGRTGVSPSRAGELTRSAHTAGLRVAGVFTFPGHGYGHDPGARERAARDEERVLAEAVGSMREEGVESPVVSGGSTPTAGAWRPGVVNELRPGVYVFNDATQHAIGTCSVDDLALMATATVISVPAHDRFVLDVGTKVLGADRSPWVSGRGFLPQYPKATVTGLWEHHAVVRPAEGHGVPALGRVLTVVPNHVCTAVNLADELVVIEDGEVLDHWSVAARGANT